MSDLSEANTIQAIPIPHNKSDVEAFLDDIFDRALDNGEIQNHNVKMKGLPKRIKGGYSSDKHNQRQQLQRHSNPSSWHQIQNDAYSDNSNNLGLIIEANALGKPIDSEAQIGNTDKKVAVDIANEKEELHNSEPSTRLLDICSTFSPCFEQFKLRTMFSTNSEFIMQHRTDKEKEIEKEIGKKVEKKIEIEDEKENEIRSTQLEIKNDYDQSDQWDLSESNCSSFNERDSDIAKEEDYVCDGDGDSKDELESNSHRSIDQTRSHQRVYQLQSQYSSSAIIPNKEYEYYKILKTFLKNKPFLLKISKLNSNRPEEAVHAHDTRQACFSTGRGQHQGNQSDQTVLNFDQFDFYSPRSSLNEFENEQDNERYNGGNHNRVYHEHENDDTCYAHNCNNKNRSNSNNNNNNNINNNSNYDLNQNDNEENRDVYCSFNNTNKNIYSNLNEVLSQSDCDNNQEYKEKESECSIGCHSNDELLAIDKDNKLKYLIKSDSFDSTSALFKSNWNLLSTNYGLLRLNSSTSTINSSIKSIKEATSTMTTSAKLLEVDKATGAGKTSKAASAASTASIEVKKTSTKMEEPFEVASETTATGKLLSSSRSSLSMSKCSSIYSTTNTSLEASFCNSLYSSSCESLIQNSEQTTSTTVTSSDSNNKQTMSLGIHKASVATSADCSKYGNANRSGACSCSCSCSVMMSAKLIGESEMQAKSKNKPKISKKRTYYVNKPQTKIFKTKAKLTKEVEAETTAAAVAEAVALDTKNEISATCEKDDDDYDMSSQFKTYVDSIGCSIHYENNIRLSNFSSKIKGGFDRLVSPQSLNSMPITTTLNSNASNHAAAATTKTTTIEVTPSRKNASFQQMNGHITSNASSGSNAPAVAYDIYNFSALSNTTANNNNPHAINNMNRQSNTSSALTSGANITANISGPGSGFKNIPPPPPPPMPGPSALQNANAQINYPTPPVPAFAAPNQMALMQSVYTQLVRSLFSI
jgi:hypothetical protein